MCDRQLCGLVGDMLNGNSAYFWGRGVEWGIGKGEVGERGLDFLLNYTAVLFEFFKCV